jgi:hypothetical protein
MVSISAPRTEAGRPERVSARWGFCTTPRSRADGASNSRSELRRSESKVNWSDPREPASQRAMRSATSACEVNSLSVWMPCAL